MTRQNRRITAVVRVHDHRRQGPTREESFKRGTRAILSGRTRYVEPVFEVSGMRILLRTPAIERERFDRWPRPWKLFHQLRVFSAARVLLLGGADGLPPGQKSSPHCLYRFGARVRRARASSPGPPDFRRCPCGGSKTDSIQTRPRPVSTRKYHGRSRSPARPCARAAADGPKFRSIDSPPAWHECCDGARCDDDSENARNTLTSCSMGERTGSFAFSLRRCCLPRR